jgi:trans-aconitate methyltransferase
MLKIAKQRLPTIRLIQADMRELCLNDKFDCMLAWHSFFHLPIPDQRNIFTTFAEHIKPGDMLMFTSGTEEGEIWSDNGGEQLYHASLSSEEYEQLLNDNGFRVIRYKPEDENCRGATIWVAQKNETIKQSFL